MYINIRNSYELVSWTVLSVQGHHFSNLKFLDICLTFCGILPNHCQLHQDHKRYKKPSCR